MKVFNDTATNRRIFTWTIPSIFYYVSITTTWRFASTSDGTQLPIICNTGPSVEQKWLVIRLYCVYSPLNYLTMFFFREKKYANLKHKINYSSSKTTHIYILKEERERDEERRGEIYTERWSLSKVNLRPLRAFLNTACVCVSKRM